MGPCPCQNLINTARTAQAPKYQLMIDLMIKYFLFISVHMNCIIVYCITRYCIHITSIQINVLPITPHYNQGFKKITFMSLLPTYILHICDLLPWLTDCDPGSPTMTVSHQKWRNPVVDQSTWLEQSEQSQYDARFLESVQSFDLWWNTEEVGSNTSEYHDLTGFRIKL